MSKESVLALFETDLTDPGSLKSGEYLQAHVLAHARSAAITDRQGLVEALTGWLAKRTEPKTMLAVTIAKELHLSELTPNLIDLRKAVVSGDAFMPFYVRWVDEALASLRAVSRSEN